MAAPGITAPVASETVPVIVPRSVRAKAVRTERNKQTPKNEKRIFMVYFSSLAEHTTHDDVQKSEEKRDQRSDSAGPKENSPNGNRTRVLALRGPRPSL